MSGQINIRQSLKKAYRKQRPTRAEIELLRRELIKMLKDANRREFDVIIAVNGEPVNTISEFRQLVRSGEVELTYVRKGEKATCTIGGD